jgi:hypothetical protein
VRLSETAAQAPVPACVAATESDSVAGGDSNLELRLSHGRPGSRHRDGHGHGHGHGPSQWPGCFKFKSSGPGPWPGRRPESKSRVRGPGGPLSRSESAAARRRGRAASLSLSHAESESESLTAAATELRLELEPSLYYDDYQNSSRLRLTRRDSDASDCARGGPPASLSDRHGARYTPSREPLLRTLSLLSISDCGNGNIAASGPNCDAAAH